MTLRIVFDNALERAATLTASSTAGALVAANLVNWKKSSLHRATSTSVTYTATWAAAEPISCVAFPFCNLSPTATIRVRAYGADGITLLYDSGAVLACPAPALRPRGFTAAQAASAYAYGGGAYARHWFPQVSAFKIVVDLVDVNNLQGYIEAACKVVGAHWSPKFDTAAAPLVPLDTADIVVTGGGDTAGEVGFISKEVGIDMTHMDDADRAKIMNMARSSAAYPVLVSIFPEHQDAAKERDYMAYATRSKSTEIGIRYGREYQTKVTFKEV